ncbi:MAG: GIY-YIG nuclease family protein [Pseudomonadota bacterium]
MTPSDGFIYVAVMSAMPKLVKIGKTTRDPDERLAEISHGLGVPEEFSCAFKMRFTDCHHAESVIHAVLAKQRYNKEFFELSIDDAVAAVRKVKALLENGAHENGYSAGSVAGSAICAVVFKSKPVVRFGVTDLSREEVLSRLGKLYPESRFMLLAFEPCASPDMTAELLKTKIAQFPEEADGFVRIEPIARAIQVVTEILSEVEANQRLDDKKRLWYGL